MKNHPAFGWLIAILSIGFVFLVNSCITVRQSGAHDTTINIVGDSNSLSMAAHRENSQQGAEAAPTVSGAGFGDEALKTGAKAAVALGTGGLSTFPQAAAKIAEDKSETSQVPAPVSPK